MATTSGKSRSQSSAGRTDKSVDAFRDALERSVTISRDRLQEIVDDSVKRGRMTRRDANELVSKVVDRGRRYRSDLLRDLERMLDQARRQATTAAGRAGRAARDAADQPMRRADALRRRAGVGGSFPISGYDQLTAAQVKSRLSGLQPADLRKVRNYEQRNKGRKMILGEVQRRLDGSGPSRGTGRKSSTSRKRSAGSRSRSRSRS